MAILRLTNGKNALVDDDDLEMLSPYRWCAWQNYKTCWYAAVKYGGKTLYMHRLIMKPDPGMEVDHINGDGLDNRRCNLRVCSHMQNQCNQRKRSNTRSTYRGVTYNGKQRRRPWKSRIKVGGQQLWLGSFATEREAARAYDAAAIRYRGAFAVLNNA